MKSFLTDEIIPEKVLLEVNKWAKEYNQKAGSDVKIQQIWYSDGDMEESRNTLFLITECKYSDRLEDAITHFEWEIMDKYQQDLNFQTWPCGYQSAKKQGFLKKVFDYTSHSE
jgi:hypothetical protein